MKELLTPAEQNELTRLETVIQKGWTTFLEVGAALVKINTERLYRDKYESFQAYCHERLGLSRQYAYSLIGSAEVNAQLSAIADIRVKPLTESQFRELIPVPEGKRVDAWKGALKLAGSEPVTAKVVRQAAAAFKPKPGKSGKPAKITKKPASASRLNLKPAFKLIDVIEELAGNDKNLLGNIRSLREYLKNLANG